MKWSKHFDVYTDEIKSAIKQYAFENYIYDPIIGYAKLPERDWFGKIFDVSEIDTLLHSGIKELLIKKGLLDKIKEKGYDKFIITPDLFSENDVPTNYPYNNEFDMDQRQLIYMNDKLFEVIDRRDWKSIKFNYNGKTYIFFPSNRQGTMVDGSSDKLEIIDFIEYSFLDEDPSVEDHWDKTTKLLLKFTENRKLFVNEEVPTEDYVLAGIRHPYLIYDYDEDFNGEHIKENPRLKLYGLKSFNKDMTITEVARAYDDTDKLMIHNRGVVFSSTAILIYKDKTFHIENFKNPIDKTKIERYDKHTVYVHKDDNIDKVLIFLHPIGVSNPRYRIDGMYDKIKEHSSKAFMLLKKLSKNTNLLLNTLMAKDDITIPELIEFGYRFDRDVLKIIQCAIPSYIPLTKSFISVSKSLFDTNFYKHKIIVRVPNRILGFPQLIINGKFISNDYKIIRRYDMDFIILDAIRVFNLNPLDVNENNLRNIVDNKINSIECVFLTDSFYDEEKLNKRPNRILSDNAIHNRIHVMDSYTGFDSSALFINGRMTYSSFVDNKDYCLNYGVHRVPCFKNIMEEPITDYFDPMNTSPNAGTLGFTRDNKSINILNKDRSGQQFYLDITKEQNIRRTLMCLNVGTDGAVGYTVFDNKVYKDEHAYVNKIELPKFSRKISRNRTVFFDYDGIVIKPNILTEEYIDPLFVSLYKHTARNPNINTETGIGFGPRNNDSFCVHWIDFGQTNMTYGLDLNIDDERISGTNVGSFNENAMKDPDVRMLFTYYSKNAEQNPIQTYANDYNELLKMKIYMTYWYAHNNNTLLNTTPEYQQIVTTHNTLFLPNGMPNPEKLRTVFKLEEEFKTTDSLYDRDLATYLFKFIDLSNVTDDIGYIADEITIDSATTYPMELTEKYKYSKSFTNETVPISNTFASIKL